jgi:hypothetical protein
MIAQTIRKNIITTADAYAKVTGKSPSDVSRDFYGRGVFLADFARAEQSISIDKLDRVMKKFRRLWPRGKNGKPLHFPVLDPVFM